MTDAKLDRKVRREILLGRYLFNPTMRGFFKVGLTPPWHTMIETTGRKTGQVRRVPVAYGRDGNTVWLIAQHGEHAGWVRNLVADPRVKLLFKREWVDGTAELIPSDDVRSRAATFAASPFGRRVLSAAVSALETRPVSVRITLG